MNRVNEIKAPTLKEKVILRLMIILGLLSVLNFIYWFFNLNLADESFLFYLLGISIGYEIVKILYIWYHYWSISLPKKPKHKSNFTVDVFTTYFPGEPHEMVKETLHAIKSITYPHRTYLCDEANDEDLKNFCRENDIVHITRDNRIDAKAGNINNALLQAKSEICAILDPDHIPVESFLDEITPYFEDEQIGFVQTVQSYYNVNQSYVTKGAAEQTFHFYGPLMMSMNTYGTVNAIGANCVFRRKALDSIGGHAAGLSEDMHTAMQMYAKGWKSIYLPKALTKGLTPSSLTSYYKQQLKWSRGTLELLVSVYPKLFKKFSWRQRIHFALLPFHYLSGISTLINILIPIISLFAATTPWGGNMVNFVLIYIPVLISILGIRFYVQNWVIHKNERGIHLVGGILQICTWWIYIIGFVYTIIRKKVLYLPTPKEDKERASWKILIPNLFVGIISIAAVIYGLSIDFTPFSIMMSGFAMLNAVFMFSTILFAFQKPKIITPGIQLANKRISFVNTFQNFIFHVWRKSAVVFIIIVMTFSASVFYKIEYLKWGGVKPEPQNKNSINYLGIFAPKIDNGITDLKIVKDISNQIDESFDIISLYLFWEKDTDTSFPHSLIDSIYNQKSIPMITWEPWLTSFKDDVNTNRHVFKLITEGYFDDYIKSFALQMRELKRPVFLRFAHEFDNPFYPWYDNSNNSASNFKKAWIHTYEIFKKNNALNVIWIWNPWKSEDVDSFYPGKEYVDWIGVNILNYGQLNKDGKWHDFEDLYEPFHNKFKNLPQTPVMISELGTIKRDQNQAEWFSDAFIAINNDYKEIKSVIFFNSEVDNNWPNGLQMKENLDWTLTKNRVIKNTFSSKEVPDYIFQPLPDIIFNNINSSNFRSVKTKNILGINLKKGHDWWEDYHVLSRKNLLNDFKEIKQLGMNTIKFEGNSIYRYNVLNISKEFDLNISYGFWISADLDFINQTTKINELKQNILESIRQQKKQNNITSWNIQNDILTNQKNFYLKPRLIYQNAAYLFWLKDLIREIKKIDSIRPVIVDLEAGSQAINYAKLLMNNIEGIDIIGLVIKDKTDLDQSLSFFQQSGINFLYSEIDANILTDPEIFQTQPSFFITAWQDAHESNKVTFDGIIDRKGRFKTEYYILKNRISNSTIEISKPKIKILRPSTLIYAGRTMDYIAMCYNDSTGWNFGGKRKDLNFEWSLVKCDEYGNYLAIKDLSTGPKLLLKIPAEYNLYKLLLTTIKGNSISTSISTLNTPLEQKSKISN